MLALGLAPGPASASFLHGETLDSLPMGMAWFAVIAMPIVGISIFWQLHVLPGKIAAKRHHPQKDAIHVLRPLLLAFGGLLWPKAWRSSAPQRTAACRLNPSMSAQSGCLKSASLGLAPCALHLRHLLPGAFAEGEAVSRRGGLQRA